MSTRTTIGSAAIHAAVSTIAETIAARHQPSVRLIILGIANGGISLSRRITSRLSALAPSLNARCGSLDISFHRDDIGRNPIPKEFHPTIIPGDVHGASVILVDDVLCSGRTIRAALDELFDHGRPSRVELAVLVDRGNRLLPIHADYVGINLPTLPDERVVVRLDESHPAHDTVRVEAQKD